MEPELESEIHAFIEQRPEVERVFNLITLQLGPDVMVAIKAEMRRESPTPIWSIRSTRVERDLKARFPEIRWSFFEPDVAD